MDAGGGGKAGEVYVRNARGKATIFLDGASGQVVTANGDCAEDFAVAGGEKSQLEAGDVAVLGDKGTLRRSRVAYDPRVAGVIAGAGDRQPGVVLGRRKGRAHRLPIALLGKVLCRADADFGAIEVGSLLTTSERPGHAMKAADSERAFGTILGKALAPLTTGQALIPVLVLLG